MLKLGFLNKFSKKNLLRNEKGKAAVGGRKGNTSIEFPVMTNTSYKRILTIKKGKEDANNEK